MRKYLSIVLSMCVLTSYGIAQSPAPEKLAVLPAGGFKFEGEWTCEGGFRGGKVHKAAFTGTSILNGTWLELTERDVEPATGYQAKYLIGYDSQQKQLVEFDANNFGAATYTSADGWQNGVLTMTSAVSQDAKQPYAANRFLYSIAGANGFTVDWQISRTATLDWIPADHLACKRK